MNLVCVKEMQQWTQTTLTVTDTATG